VLARVAVPIAAPSLAAGAATAYARALGEFGATLLFAGSLEGRTQTLPLAIYAAMDADLGAARAMACLLVVASLGLLVAARAATQRAARGEGRTT
jgi:molybdate transport system permease protein